MLNVILRLAGNSIILCLQPANRRLSHLKINYKCLRQSKDPKINERKNKKIEWHEIDKEVFRYIKRKFEFSDCREKLHY